MVNLIMAVMIFCSMVWAEAEVPIQAEFARKIVYTTDASADQESLKRDCQQRGGKFNQCGSICDGDVEGMMCASVCAYTCESR